MFRNNYKQCSEVNADTHRPFITQLTSVQPPLQRVLNAAARSDHVTVPLTDLNLIPVAAPIEYKLCTLVYQSITGNAPTYIPVTCCGQCLGYIGRLYYDTVKYQIRTSA